MSFTFIRTLRPGVVLAFALIPQLADADLIFDIDSPGLNVVLEYHVDGFAYGDFPNPDVEEIIVDWSGTARSHSIWEFDDSGVGFFFDYREPFDGGSFLLDFIGVFDVPAFGNQVYRAFLYADNTEGNTFATGEVLVDTPHLLVMTIEGGAHSNIPVFPVFSWEGVFTITATRVPEPSAVALVAFALLGCAWRRRRAQGPG